MIKYLLSAVSLSSLLCLTGAVAQDPQSKEKKAQEGAPRVPDFEGLLELKAFSVSGLGVVLDIEKAQQVVDDRGDRIHVAWALSHQGYRPPLVVLEPSLKNRMAFGKTRLYFYATGKSGKAYQMEFHSPPLVPPGPAFPITPKEWFVSLAKGETRTGVLEIDTADLKQYFTHKLPQEFDPVQPPRLYAQMSHTVEDRVARLHQLDAWIGKLISSTIPVTMKKW
jgi:hypothetical protein